MNADRFDRFGFFSGGIDQETIPRPLAALKAKDRTDDT